MNLFALAKYQSVIFDIHRSVYSDEIKVYKKPKVIVGDITFQHYEPFLNNTLTHAYKMFMEGLKLFARHR